MNKMFSVLFGVGIFSLGLLALAANSLLPLVGIRLYWLEPWRYWPLIVLGVGCFLTALALMSIRRRGFGVLFIPALPVLTTGGLLLFSSLFNMWWVWKFAWSLIVVSLALGFVLAAFASRIVWLGIPAILLGLNSLVLAFCSFTGMWGAWSVLWTIEPLAVGMVLLLIALKTRSAAVGLIGLLMCGFAGTAFYFMTGLFFFAGWGFRLAGPATLILLGGLLLAWGLFGRMGIRQQNNGVVEQ